MAKLTLGNIGATDASSIINTVNTNNDAIEAAVEKTLSRDGTPPNQMLAQLDMNSKRIINLPAAVNPTEPVRLAEFAGAVFPDLPDFGAAPPNTVFAGPATGPSSADAVFRSLVTADLPPLPPPADGSISTGMIQDGSITNAKLADMPAFTIKGRSTASTGDPQDILITQALDFIPGSEERGDILYRGASTWETLAPGTPGHFLQTAGPGADPGWVAVAGGSGSGDVVGPASSLNAGVVLYSGTTGKLIQDSQIVFLTAPLTLWVRVDGTNTIPANGLHGLADTAAGAFLTWQAAYDHLVTRYYLNGHNVTIKAGGTGIRTFNNFSLELSRSWRGEGQVVFEGDSSNPDNVVLSSTILAAISIFPITPSGLMTFRGFRITTSAASGIGIRHAGHCIAILINLHFFNCRGASVATIYSDSVCEQQEAGGVGLKFTSTVQTSAGLLIARGIFIGLTFNFSSGFNTALFVDVTHGGTVSLTNIAAWVGTFTGQTYQVRNSGDLRVDIDLDSPPKGTLAGNCQPGSSYSIGTITAKSGDIFALTTPSIDNRIARWDGTAGNLIQISPVTIDDSGNITGVGNITSSGSLSSGAISATTINSSGLATLNSISTGTLTTSGLITANGGLSTTTITSSALATLNSISTGTITASGLITANGGISNTGTITSTGNITSSGGTVTGSNLSTGGTTTTVGITSTGAVTVSGSHAAALAVGLNGNTNPALRVISNIASGATGVEVVPAVAGSNAVIRAISSGTNEQLRLEGKGTSGALVQGKASNAATPAGYVGEILESEVLLGSAISLTNATPASITSIVLTPGDWDVWGSIAYKPAGTTTMTALFAALNTSPSLPVIPNGGARTQLQISFTTGLEQVLSAGQRRFSVNTNTTVHLVSTANFGVSTMTAYGYIGARRVA